MLESRIPADAGRVADVGCGDARIGVGRFVVGVDLFRCAGTTVRADAARLPFRAGALDAAICNIVYPGHTRGFAARGPREICRALKPGGVLAFSFQNHSNPVVRARWVVRRFWNERRTDAAMFSPWSVPVRLRREGLEISELVSISIPPQRWPSKLVHRLVATRPGLAPVWAVVGRKR